jgi:hypothetical protein
VTALPNAHAELIAAYLEWERASDACLRKLARRSKASPFDRKDEPDLPHLRQLYCEWVARLESLSSPPDGKAISA